MEGQKPIRNKPNPNSEAKSEVTKLYASPNFVSKAAAKVMLGVYLQHSELLNNIKDLKSFPLPNDYSYVDKSSFKLAERDLTMARNLQLKCLPMHLWKEIQIIYRSTETIASYNNHTSVESKERKKDIPKQPSFNVFGSKIGSDNHTPTKSNRIPKEIQITPHVARTNVAADHCTPTKRHNAPRIADDSGFSEAIPDVPLASSSRKKEHLKVTNTPDVDKASQPSVSTSDRKGSHFKKSSAEKDCVEICPICGYEFPLSLIQDHASACGSDNVDLLEVTPSKRDKNPERLAKSEAKKRIIGDRKQRHENNHSISLKTVRENANAVGGEAVLEVETFDDDVTMVENQLSASSRKKKRRSQFLKSPYLKD